MTVVPFTQVTSMLGIDAKTLRQWLKQSQLTLQAHPTDARIKCLTMEQVQQLAVLHHRLIKEDTAALSTQMLVQDPPEPDGKQLESQMTPILSDHPLPSTLSSYSDLVQSHVSLQATVANLQQQVAQLALELLQERTGRYEQRLCRLEAPNLPDVEPSPAVQTSEVVPVADMTHPAPPPERRSPLAESVRGSRGKLPLIAYTATGSYVVICPTNGELALLPDTAEWFEWLATLSSFRFLGKLGRLSASRPSGRPNWTAYRRIHHHRYSYGLGNTKRLTLAHLEQMAATLQSHVPTLS
jgi:hypothetical protein